MEWNSIFLDSPTLLLNLTQLVGTIMFVLTYILLTIVVADVRSPTHLLMSNTRHLDRGIRYLRVVK